MRAALEVLAEDDRALLRPEPPPRSYRPMLATLTDARPSGREWLFERKLDGVRCGALRAGGRVRLLSRNGKDLGGAYPEIAEAVSALPAGDLAVDGEVVAFEGTRTSFARLQARMQLRDPDQARGRGVEVFLYLFDLLHLDGQCTADLPLRSRKELLRAAIPLADPLRFTKGRAGDGEALLREACAEGWEGLIAKRADAPYAAARSRDWLKLKCVAEQELVVGGFTAPRGSRTELGALLVGYQEDGVLRYAGKVGTGFDRRTLADLGKRLRALEQPDPPFADARPVPAGTRWVRPELVAQIAFTEWTRDGRLRHPRYLGLREDKAAAEVVREAPA